MHPPQGPSRPPRSPTGPQVSDASWPAFSLVEDGLERVCEAGDDQCGCVGAWDDDGLLVQCGEYVLDELLGHSRCLGTYQGHEPVASGLADLGRGTELSRSLSTAGCWMRGPRTRSSDGWICVSRP